MRQFAFAAACAGAWLAAAPAAAQVNPGFMASVIGNTIAAMNQGTPDPCLQGKWEPTEEQAGRFTLEAQPALRAYLALAATGADLAPAFTNRKADRHWSIDGEARPLEAVSDPWAARVARLEPLGLRLGGMKVRGRGLWRAFAADGTELGIYDGLFRRKTRGFEVSSLDLYSPGAAKQPPALAGFCYTPGDIEAFREALAKHEAEKAARKAAREAERNASR